MKSYETLKVGDWFSQGNKESLFPLVNEAYLKKVKDDYESDVVNTDSWRFFETKEEGLTFYS